MKERMVVFGFPAIGMIGVLLLLQGQAEQQSEKAKKRAQIERGEYLVTAADCNGCHTLFFIETPEGMVWDTTRRLAGSPEDAVLPEIPEGLFSREGMFSSGKWLSLYSSGGAFAGPWGVSFPRNLTPDMETGLGSWTEEIFIKALRTGKDMGEGRDILPPMPWREFAKLTDEDLGAIFAYLGSIAPIDNMVPDPISPTGERLETLRKLPQN